MTENRWGSKVGHSQSFNETEIACMDTLLTKLRAGGDVSMLTQHPAFANLARKFMQMRQKIEHRKNEAVHQKYAPAATGGHEALIDPDHDDHGGHRMTTEQVLFLDLETTGLDPRQDLVLEAAMVCVDFKTLDVLWEAQWLARFGHKIPTWVMSQTVQQMHEQSGLFRDLASLVPTKDFMAPCSSLQPSTVPLEEWLLHITEREGAYRPGELRIAGYSPHFDMSFLQVKAPVFSRFLYHQVIDVTTMRSCLRAWSVWQSGKAKAAHRARADCYAALEELRQMQGMIVGACRRAL